MSARQRPELRDGSIIPQVHSARYVGCDINDQADAGRDIANRIRTCTGKCRRLEFLWKHTGCPKGRTDQAWDAVVRPKLLYGLEALQIVPPLLSKIEIVHLRGLTQILKITST